MSANDFIPHFAVVNEEPGREASIDVTLSTMPAGMNTQLTISVRGERLTIEMRSQTARAIADAILSMADHCDALNAPLRPQVLL